MKASRGLGQLLTVVAALTPIVSAWPEWLPQPGTLAVRQDDSTTTAESTETTATSTTKADTTATSDADKTTTDTTKTTNGPKTTNLNTGGKSTSGGSKTATGSKSSNSTSRTTFDALDGAGGVAMITPAASSGTQLYKIENPTPITWVWNYTSLQGTPSAIDVFVSCPTASATWTLTQNMTYEPTATFTWDTAKFQSEEVQQPLLTEMYTLIIIEADTSISAAAEAGYLAPYDSFKFGLYKSKEYSDLGEWKCATCSAASGDLDRQALKFAVGMSIVTVLSFTWYAAGLGALL